MKTSFVWEYFSSEGNFAHCKFAECGKVLNAAKGTKSLAYHLEKNHFVFKTESKDISWEAGEVISIPTNAASGSSAQSSEEPKPKRQKTLFESFERVTLEETVARLAADDGFTVEQITKSKYIQRSLGRDFPDRIIPQNQNEMMQLIDDYYSEVKESVTEKLAKLKEDGSRFTATLDEWTRIKNFRYMNVKVSCTSTTEKVNLGMIKIQRSCSADDMCGLVSSLTSFKFPSIIGSITVCWSSC